jgi:CoA:oxalate CoA-transferase
LLITITAINGPVIVGSTDPDQMDGAAPGPVEFCPPSSASFGLFNAKDIYLVIAVGNDPMLPKVCDARGVPEAKDDPRFAASVLRCKHPAEMKIFLEQVLAARTAEEWLQQFGAASLPCGPVNDMADVMQDPQVNARGMLMALPLPNGGTMVTAGCPVHLQAINHVGPTRRLRWISTGTHC